MKEGMNDNQIAGVIAKEESKARGVDITARAIGSWIAKNVNHPDKRKRLKENPNRGKTDYDYKHIRKERERLIRVYELSDSRIATILADKNKDKGWKQSHLVDLIIEKVNDPKTRWQRNFNNPDFGDKAAAREMMDRYIAFVRKAGNGRNNDVSHEPVRRAARILRART